VRIVLSRRTLVWIIAIAIVVPAAAVVASSAYFAVALPGCESCHVTGQFGEATQASVHGTVSCTSCHVSQAPVDRAAFGVRQLTHMVIPLVNGEGRGWSTVTDDACTKCHSGVKERVVSARGIRVNHALCSEGSACIDCHSAVAHGQDVGWQKSYDMEQCLGCHVARASTECDVCHEPRDRQERIASGSFAVTHGRTWRQTHGMGDVSTCAVCHSAADCGECHGAGVPHDAKFLQSHAETANQASARCESCHERSFCDGCHQTTMPHTRKFKTDHASAAKADRDLCARCHVDSDCTGCHEKHVHPGGAIGPASGASMDGDAQ